MSAGRKRDMRRVREAGDSALLLELGAAPAIDVSVNARAIAIAAAVRARRIPGVRDVVPTFRSVGVFFDPLRTDVESVASCLHELDEIVADASGRDLVEVPVTYGGAAGPDLDAVAAFAGCSAQAVIERHASRTYRVFMLGFLPGFPYMASVDDAIAAPRHPTPRLRVPAGSVGIAGRQTGIYPSESPGGWQIIGRTPLRVFDPARTPPALFAPGDRVRFTPRQREGLTSDGDEPFHDGGTAHARADRPGSVVQGAGHVTVLRPGLLTTVQDSGRWGYQASGVPVAGPMDAVAYRLANATVANASEAAALEITIVGPELRFERQTMLAIAGADLDATLDGAAVPLREPVRCHEGSVLRFGGRRTGARAYLAFAGGVDVAPVLGSRATHVRSGLGGLDGRALRSGDRLPLGLMADPPRRLMKDSAPSAPAGGARLRILPGPQADLFPADALERLQRTRFTISPQSDRMGYRLLGHMPTSNVLTAEMISDVTFPGAVQVPPSGGPVLLLADRQTTGGYPQIAIVITADLPAAAQLVPGDWLEFQMCTRSEAVAALIAQEARLLAAY